jgi:hypothetical protein
LPGQSALMRQPSLGPGSRLWRACRSLRMRGYVPCHITPNILLTMPDSGSRDRFPRAIAASRGEVHSKGLEEDRAGPRTRCDCRRQRPSCRRGDQIICPVEERSPYVSIVSSWFVQALTSAASYWHQLLLALRANPSILSANSQVMAALTGKEAKFIKADTLSALGHARVQSVRLEKPWTVSHD